MNKTINHVTNQIGTLDEITERLETAKSDLHIAKVSLLADVMTNEIMPLKNNSFFPVFEITAFMTYSRH